LSASRATGFPKSSDNIRMWDWQGYTVYTCKKSYVSTMWLLQEGM